MQSRLPLCLLHMYQKRLSPGAVLQLRRKSRPLSGCHLPEGFRCLLVPFLPAIQAPGAAAAHLLADAPSNGLPAAAVLQHPGNLQSILPHPRKSMGKIIHLHRSKSRRSMLPLRLRQPFLQYFTHRQGQIQQTAGSQIDQQNQGGGIRPQQQLPCSLNGQKQQADRPLMEVCEIAGCHTGQSKEGGSLPQ